LNGNQQAQEKLYKKYKKSIYNFLKNKYSVYYDLEDDVSEILIKIFMNLESFDESKSKFKSWAFSITKNYMIDKWRSNTVNIVSLTNGTILNGDFTNNVSCNINELYTTQSTTNNYFCSNTAFETSNSINYISTQLSPQDFTLLNMKYIHGYDYNEIGKEFNVTSSTISNKINYIKTKLKKSITEDIYD